MELVKQDFKCYDIIHCSKVFKLWLETKRKEIPNTSKLRLIKESDEKVIFKHLSINYQLEYILYRRLLAKKYGIEIE